LSGCTTKIGGIQKQDPVGFLACNDLQEIFRYETGIYDVKFRAGMQGFSENRAGAIVAPVAITDTQQADTTVKEMYYLVFELAVHVKPHIA